MWDRGLGHGKCVALRHQEAAWLADQILSLPPAEASPILNIGSSTSQFNERRPWLSELLYGPIADAGIKLVNVDIKNAPGVDLVGDITDSAFRSEVASVGARAVLCSNLLEHVPDPLGLARALPDCLPDGGTIFASGPSAFPYHPDPLDNRLRPSLSEFVSMFGDLECIAEARIPTGSMRTDMTPALWARFAARLALPVYRPADWAVQLRRLGWINRDYEAVACVLRVARADSPQLSVGGQEAGRGGRHTP